MAQNVLIDFMPPGMVEIGVADVEEATVSTGYGPLGLGDLQVDRDTQSGTPLAYVAYNFHQTFFETLQALDEINLPDRYNLPQAQLYNLSLRQLLTWIYTHYVLEHQALKIAA
jgi:hypothetical protein